MALKVNGPLSRIATFITDQLRLQTMVSISSPIHAARWGLPVIERLHKTVAKSVQDSFVLADPSHPEICTVRQASGFANVTHFTHAGRHDKSGLNERATTGTRMSNRMHDRVCNLLQLSFAGRQRRNGRVCRAHDPSPSRGSRP